MLCLAKLGLAEINSVALASKMSLSPVVMEVLGVLVALITSEWNIAVNTVQRFSQMFVNV